MHAGENSHGRSVLTNCLPSHTHYDGATSLGRVHPARLHKDLLCIRARHCASGFAHRLAVQAWKDAGKGG